MDRITSEAEQLEDKEDRLGWFGHIQSTDLVKEVMQKGCCDKLDARAGERQKQMIREGSISDSQ